MHHVPGSGVVAQGERARPGAHTSSAACALAPRHEPSHHPRCHPRARPAAAPARPARARPAPARADVALSTTATTSSTGAGADPPPPLDDARPPPPTCAWPLPPAARARALLSGGRAGPYPDLTNPAREYEFSARQEGPFTRLEGAMVACARAYGALAVTAAAHGALLLAHGAGHAAAPPPPPGALAVAAAEAGQAAAVAFVLWVASAAFGQVAASRGSDIAWCLSGVRDLGAALAEVAIMGTGLALLHVGVAAAAWPGGALPLVAGLTAAATAGRALTHGRPDRVGRALRAPSTAVRLLTAPLRAVRGRRGGGRAARAGRPTPVAAFKSAQARLPPRPPAGLASVDCAHTDGGGGGGGAGGDGGVEAEYEFDDAQEQPLAGAIGALHLACLARLLQASSEAVLCAACVATGRPGEAAVAAVGALETAASAALFFFATDSFRAVITTAGSDLAHLLAGLSGLARMFSRLEHVIQFAIVLRVVPEVASMGWGALSAAVGRGGGWGAAWTRCVAAVLGGGA